MAQQGGGIPGNAVMMATAGAFLLYVGITGAGIRDGMKSLVGGNLPEGKAKSGDAIGKAEAALAQQGVPATGGGEGGGPVGSGSHPELATAGMSYLGVPYVWGGATSSGLDCSGLVVLAFKKAYGVTPPRTTYTQIAWKRLRKIPNSQIGAGDLLFWPRTGPPSHVGIATSATSVVHAPRPGKSVEEVPINKAFTGGAAPVAYRYVGG